MDILIASGNAGKIREIRELGAHLNWSWIGLDSLEGYESPEEIGTSFKDNAILKAVAGLRHSGWVTIGEDSGLCVDALDGGPGIYSARFGGVHGDNARNNRKLLEALADVPDEQRGAHYTCATAVAFHRKWFIDGSLVPDGSVLVRDNPFLPEGIWAWVTEGQVHGVIAREESGDGGFGYDPIFFYPAFGKTFAESTPQAKHAVSHRAAAMGRLFEWFDGEPLRTP